MNGHEVHEKVLSITNYKGNTNQSPSEITRYLLGQLSSKWQEVTIVSEDVRKRELCLLLVGM